MSATDQSLTRVLWREIENTSEAILERPLIAGPTCRSLRGQRLRHLCLRVADIEKAMTVGRWGLAFIEASPRRDIDRLRVFGHPRSFNGILVGLVGTR